MLLFEIFNGDFTVLFYDWCYFLLSKIDESYGVLIRFRTSCCRKEKFYRLGQVVAEKKSFIDFH